jgi:hypothetical protein
MDTRQAAVVQDLLVRAAGVFQRVAEDEQAVEGTVVAGGLG